MKVFVRKIALAALMASPLWGSNPTHLDTALEVSALQFQMRRITQSVQENLEKHPDASSVIIMGPTGSGKSTFVNLLAKKKFIGQRANIGYKVSTDDPLPHFTINHQNSVGTIVPSSWYDINHHILFWDCPGFGDPRGASAEITNAFSIHKLFKPNIKIVLISSESNLEQDRATGFLKLLRELASLFPHDQSLKQSLSVVFSKQQNALDIPGYFREEILPLSQDQQHYLTPEVRDILQFLVDNPAHITFFPRPQTEGIYAPNMESIWQAIHSSAYMVQPNPQIKISSDATLYIDALGRHINQDIVDAINTQGKFSILAYCYDLINDHQRPVEDLRDIFRGLIGDLRSLQHTTDSLNPYSFTQRLTDLFGRYFNVDEIDQAIENIRFCKSIRPEVPYELVQWSNAFLPTLDCLQHLITPPETQVIHNLLTLKGMLVGTSDVRKALTIHRSLHPHINRIDLFGLRAFFIDENLVEPGTSLYLFSPVWKVIDAKTIDIRGTPGRDGLQGVQGTDGQPGYAGGNGGNLYGKGSHFYGMENLLIQTQGGQGGKGGNGGNGADGINGINGDLSRARKVGNTFYYDAQGTDGAPGQDGGKGGQGGLGGHSGYAFIDNYLNLILPDGAVGENGMGGRGGNGGVHGQHAQGIFLTGRTRQDAYQEQESYSDQEPYEVQEPYRDLETYSIKVPYEVKQRRLRSTKEDFLINIVKIFAFQFDHIWGDVKKIPNLGTYPPESPSYEYRFVTRFTEQTESRPVTKYKTMTNYRAVTKYRPITKYRSVSIPDEWSPPLGYAPPRGSAHNGNNGNGLNSVGLQEPIPQTPLDQNVDNQYRDYMNQQSNDPTINPLL